MGREKTALVAGGAGFIGFHLCRRLLDEGMEVVCLDNLQTGSLDNIRLLSENPRFRFVNHDILQPYNGLQKIDCIFNLACPASPPHYQRNPINTLKTCVIGMLNLLELAQMHGCPILLASTSEIYGDAEVNPQPETYNGNVNPIGIRSCYDEGKRCAEVLCMDFYRQYHVNVKIVRIFNTYGPNMAVGDGRVISNFIVQALGGKPVTIYGDGSHTRSFMYVEDLVEGLVRMIHSPEGFTGPVNFGNPDERSIKDLATIVIRMCGSQSSIVYQPLPSDDPHRRQPDITLARKALGWSPAISLEEGLQRTIEYFKSFNQ